MQNREKIKRYEKIIDKSSRNHYALLIKTEKENKEITYEVEGRKGKKNLRTWNRAGEGRDEMKKQSFKKQNQ